MAANYSLLLSEPVSVSQIPRTDELTHEVAVQV